MAALPKAQRAGGTAMARNNIAMLIPCHRVIRESGDAGLYRWGTERKRAIIVKGSRLELFTLSMSRFSNGRACRP